MGRITLRPLTEDDLSAVEAWYPEAGQVVHQLDERAHVQMLRLQLAEAWEADGELLAIAGADDEPIGIVDYGRDDPEGWLLIGVIALAAGQRGWGHGAEAVRLVEKRTQAERFRVTVNAKNGLSLYFWLRQGYRPAHPGDGLSLDGRERGIISMVRYAEAVTPKA